MALESFDTLYMKIKFDEHDKRLQKSYSTKCVKRNGDFLVVGGTEARSKDVREGLWVVCSLVRKWGYLGRMYGGLGGLRGSPMVR